VFGEILEHAFADAIVGGLDAQRERVPGVFHRLDAAAVHGDHLAEFDEIGRIRFLQRANAIFGNDLAHQQPRLRRDCGGLSDPKHGARREYQGTVFEGFLGQGLGSVLLKHLGLLGNAGQDLGQGGLWRRRLRRQKHRQQGGREQRHVSILMRKKRAGEQSVSAFFITACIDLSVSAENSWIFFAIGLAYRGRSLVF
jgi:hypothetical protein